MYDVYIRVTRSICYGYKKQEGKKVLNSFCRLKPEIIISKIAETLCIPKHIPQIDSRRKPTIEEPPSIEAPLRLFLVTR